MTTLEIMEGISIDTTLCCNTSDFHLVGLISEGGSSIKIRNSNRYSIQKVGEIEFTIFNCTTLPYKDCISYADDEESDYGKVLLALKDLKPKYVLYFNKIRLEEDYRHHKLLTFIEEYLLRSIPIPIDTLALIPNSNIDKVWNDGMKQDPRLSKYYKSIGYRASPTSSSVLYMTIDNKKEV